ncbi:MAG: Multidrug resistance protein NorM [Legionellaceae bacterium]
MKLTIYCNEAKKNLKIALPLVAANLVQASSGFISTFLIAKLGTNSLAASGLVSSLYLTFSVVFIGMFSSMSVLFSQAHGSNQPDKISILLKHSILLIGLTSISMILILWVLHLTLHYNIIEPRILALATHYLHSMIWVIIPCCCLTLIEQMLIGLEKSTEVMILSLLCCPLEIFASYTLMFGKFGLPRFGIAGIGYGLSITYTIITLLAIIYISQHKDMRQYNPFASTSCFEFKLLKEILKISWPIAIMYGIEISLFAVIALLMGKFGATILNAHQIVMQFLRLEMSVIFAFMQATSIRVGFTIGNRDFTKLTIVGAVGMSLAITIAMMIGGIYCLYPETLIALDISSQQMSSGTISILATKLFIVVAVFQIAEAIRIVAIGALRGMKDTRFAMINSLIAFWLIGFSLSYILGIILKGEAIGLWLGITIGMFCSAVILVLRYHHLTKRYTLRINEDANGKCIISSELV